MYTYIYICLICRWPDGGEDNFRYPNISNNSNNTYYYY